MGGLGGVPLWGPFAASKGSSLLSLDAFVSVCFCPFLTAVLVLVRRFPVAPEHPVVFALMGISTFASF
jgi:hypothetical protein